MTAASALHTYSWKGSSLTKPIPFVLPVFGLVPKRAPAATEFANVGFSVVLSMKNAQSNTPTKDASVPAAYAKPPFPPSSVVAKAMSCKKP